MDWTNPEPELWFTWRSKLVRGCSSSSLFLLCNPSSHCSHSSTIYCFHSTHFFSHWLICPSHACLLRFHSPFSVAKFIEIRKADLWMAQRDSRIPNTEYSHRRLPKVICFDFRMLTFGWRRVSLFLDRQHVRNTWGESNVGFCGNLVISEITWTYHSNLRTEYSSK